MAYLRVIACLILFIEVLGNPLSIFLKPCEVYKNHPPFPSTFPFLQAVLAKGRDGPVLGLRNWLRELDLEDYTHQARWRSAWRRRDRGMGWLMVELDITHHIFIMVMVTIIYNNNSMKNSILLYDHILDLFIYQSITQNGKPGLTAKFRVFQCSSGTGWRFLTVHIHSSGAFCVFWKSNTESMAMGKSVKYL